MIEKISTSEVDLNEYVLQRMWKYFYTPAFTDPKTGLYSRRFLLNQTSNLLKSASRYHYPVSVIMCDIDKFKLVNHQHG